MAMWPSRTTLDSYRQQETYGATSSTYRFPSANLVPGLVELDPVLHDAFVSVPGEDALRL